MSDFSKLVLALTIATQSALALPFISPQGVVSAASFASPSLPGGALAQGSIFSIFGRELGPGAGVQASEFPLPTELDDVSVTVTQGATVVDAIVLFVRLDQINAIMPSNAPLGRVVVRVRVGAESSNGIPVAVVESNAGLFSVNSAGYGPGIVQNVADDGLRTLNSIYNSAKPGQILVLWGNGLGPVDGADDVAPTPRDVSEEVEIYLGGVKATPEELLYAGRSGCCAGLDQFVVRVPASAPQGCYVPVEVRKGGLTSNAVTMAVAEDGGDCSDPGNPFGDVFLDPARTGVLMLFRFSQAGQIDRPERASSLGDYGVFISAQLAAAAAPLILGDSDVKQGLLGRFFFSSFVSLPPPGTCLTGSANGLRLLDAESPARLSGASSVRLDGAGGARVIDFGDADIQLIGGVSTGVDLAAAPYLRPGTYQASASAGGDVGEFGVDVAVPDLPSWENRSEVVVIDRSQPLQLDWRLTGSADQLVGLVVLASTSGYPTTSTVVCLEDGAVGTFAIPARHLGRLPASGSRPYSGSGIVILMAAPSGAPTHFEADGLDQGVALGVAAVGRPVVLE